MEWNPILGTRYSAAREGEAATPNRMEVVTGAGGDEDARAPKSRRLGRARCGHPQAGSVLEL